MRAGACLLFSMHTPGAVRSLYTCALPVVARSYGPGTLSSDQSGVVRDASARGGFCGLGEFWRIRALVCYQHDAIFCWGQQRRKGPGGVVDGLGESLDARIRFIP